MNEYIIVDGRSMKDGKMPLKKLAPIFQTQIHLSCPADVSMAMNHDASQSVIEMNYAINSEELFIHVHRRTIEPKGSPR